MPRRTALVRRLADGALHSGEALARELGVTRAAVAKHVRGLRELGLEVESVPGLGHRLARPLDLLEVAAIRGALPAAARERLRALELLETTESTNSRLLAMPDLPAGRFDACVAEWQSGGRGRRGRTWLAPYGRSICLSFSWTFEAAGAALASLSLAAGVAVLRALETCGARDVRLKWPNDLVVGERKLGGLLCEMRAEASGPAFVVVGIGLNGVTDAALAEQVLAAGGVAPVGLADVPGFAASRSDCAGRLLGEFVRMALEFERTGFQAFREEWLAADALAGRAVHVHGAEGVRAGIARGIDASGELRVEIDGRLVRVGSGEVTVRRAPGDAA